MVCEHFLSNVCSSVIKLLTCFLYCTRLPIWWTWMKILWCQNVSYTISRMESQGRWFNLQPPLLYTVVLFGAVEWNQIYPQCKTFKINKRYWMFDTGLVARMQVAVRILFSADTLSRMSTACSPALLGLMEKVSLGRSQACYITFSFRLLYGFTWFVSGWGWGNNIDFPPMSLSQLSSWSLVREPRLMSMARGWRSPQFSDQVGSLFVVLLYAKTFLLIEKFSNDTYQLLALNINKYEQTLWNTM